MNRKSDFLPTIAAICLTFFLFSIACKKTTETYKETVSFEELMPLSVGKAMYYRLDSGVIELKDTNTTPIINKYLLKEEISRIEYNNLNQPMWRVDKYLNQDTSGNGEWIPDGFYFITPLNDQIIVTENTLRYIKLVRPIREDYSWSGNSYLPDDSAFSYLPGISFPIVEINIPNWKYKYVSVNNSVSLPGMPLFDNVTTVEQINNQNNIPPDFELGEGSINASVASQELSIEKYAKGVGLIYKEQELWEFQDNNNKITILGFRLKKWLVNR
jgi:hypothetical protein